MVQFQMFFPLHRVQTAVNRHTDCTRYFTGKLRQKDMIPDNVSSLIIWHQNAHEFQCFRRF